MAGSITATNASHYQNDMTAVCLHVIATPSVTSRRTDGNVNLEDCLDIIATQGASLITRGNTPIFEKAYDIEFASDLCLKLDALGTTQAVRLRKYGSAAENWPISRTPPEVVQQRKDKLESLLALMEAANTPSTRSVASTSSELEKRDADLEEQRTLERVSTSDGTKNDTKETPIALGRPECSSQATGLPTPPPPTDETVPKVSQGRKRRRGFDVDDEQKMERPTKVHTNLSNNSSIATNKAELEALQMRKRRRGSNAAGEQRSERQNKIRIAATPASITNLWVGRLRSCAKARRPAG